MFSLSDGVAEMLGVPKDNDRRQQVEASYTEMLSFAGSIADFTLASDAQGVLEGMMGLTLEL